MDSGVVTTSGRFDESLFEDDTPAVRTVGAKNLISLPIVELAAFWLFASSDHGQPYINVAQVPSHRLSKPSCDACRNHRASATDRAAANSEDKAAHPRPV